MFLEVYLRVCGGKTEAASHNHLNDEHTETPNRIFDTILNITP